jgi:hypothetical protein
LNMDKLLNKAVEKVFGDDDERQGNYARRPLDIAQSANHSH